MDASTLRCFGQDVRGKCLDEEPTLKLLLLEEGLKVEEPLVYEKSLVVLLDGWHENVGSEDDPLQDEKY